MLVDPESFFVKDAEGPLAEGELERGKAWAEVVLAAARAHERSLTRVG